MTYEAYTITIIDDMEYWGTECTQEQATEYSNKLAEMAKAAFPGVETNVGHHCRGMEGGAYGGPDGDPAVKDAMEKWLDDNWTNAIG